MIYYFNNDIEIGNKNPINGLPFDDSWIILMLTDSADYQMFCGSENGSAYILRISKKYHGWEFAVCDFLGFHTSANKNIILIANESDIQYAKKKYANHSYNERILRENEPRVLVHSTTYESWRSIRRDGYLKSWNTLQAENKIAESSPIGALLSDPADFSDYIMFSCGAVSGEIVVASKQNGKITMDENVAYRSGVRLYFDLEKIAADGLLLRDGEHLKVKCKMPLKPYLLWYSDYKRIGLPSRITTPIEFTVKSNAEFNKLFNADIHPA